MEKIKYSFSNGLECYQDELTGTQDVKLLNLLAKIQIDEETFKKMTLVSLMDMLIKNEIFTDFFKIIFIDENGNDASILEEQIMSLKNSEYERVIEDFFSLNPTAMKLFSRFVPMLGSINSIPTTEVTNSTLKSELTTGGEKEKHS